MMEVMREVLPNGKNLKMYKFYTHCLMDRHPEQSFRTAESMEVMQEFMKHLSSNWNGTAYGAEELSPSEYFKLRNSRYWRGMSLELDNLACDCDQEWCKEYTELLNK